MAKPYFPIQRPRPIAKAPTGIRGLDEVTKGGASPPTHVLLDLKLPIKSGLEVLEWIRKHPTLGGIPVIVLTSSDVPSDVENARSLGIDAYLIKPLATKDLVVVIRTIAERWSLR